MRLPGQTGSGLGRPAIGIALGGGSARGIAHVGVIRWLEEHRVPIDFAAGTSMGGLVGGAHASGMDSAELAAFILQLDWDGLFGASTFPYKNIRRKGDARDYPSRLEFGIRQGIVPPTALNSGQAVDLMLGRIAAPYFDAPDFDALPTPFSAVAVDLITARQVILRRGSLADAMRATMSLPLIFPPVQIDGYVLVDGGALNNVPADVAKAMGADRVIAINVGELGDRDALNYSLMGLAGETIDAMMRASTRQGIAAADLVINVPLAKYGSLDWRHASELIEEGYRAAEAQRDRLLPLALSEAQFDAWRQARQGRRRSTLPVPRHVRLDGFSDNDARRLTALLARHVDLPLDLAKLEEDIAHVSGMDRYDTITWQVERDSGHEQVLVVRGRAKVYAPPFLMLGLNLENTTSTDFRMTATARLLAFDVVGSGSELRVDGTVGSNPALGGELYRPLGASPLFVTAYAGVAKKRVDFIAGDEIVARYRLSGPRAGFSVGANVGARSDVRIGGYIGRTTATTAIGDASLPQVEGKDRVAEIEWRVDTQDSPIVPTGGVSSRVRLSRIADAPPKPAGSDARFDEPPITQFEANANLFRSLRGRGRIFTYGAIGTSFSRHPLPTSQFVLGAPFRLGAYDTGEIRGSNEYVVTAGYVHQVGRLPDFLGGPIFAGAWLENGDAFEQWSNARWRSNGGMGIVMDTLIGPLLVGGSWGFDGRWRTYLGVGRLFR
jgi:NTE family protein